MEIDSGRSVTAAAPSASVADNTAVKLSGQSRQDISIAVPQSVRRPMALRTSEPAIFVEGLTKSFGDVHALRGLDLTVERGRILGVLGPNGAGKTTAVRILTTLLRPDGGRALICGHDVARAPAEVRRVIGLAGQSPAIQGELTGRENLAMFARLFHLEQAAARQRADELLERFDLTAVADRSARTYSGGMLRLLDLAASFLVSPPVLFLDEPTTGLDPRGRQRAWDVIREFTASGMTIFLTTQYLDEAEELADEIVVIDHGLVIASGTADELKDSVGGDMLQFTTPRTQLDTAAAEVARTLSSAELLQIDRTVGQLSVAVGGSGSQKLVEALRLLDQADIEVKGIALRRPSLDEAFLSLTGHAAHKQRSQLPSAIEPAQISIGALAAAPVQQSYLRRGYRTLTDILTVARRNVITWTRMPAYLVTTLLQPVMFLMVFRYVFGEAIKVTNVGGYVNFLLPGVIAQSIGFAAFGTGVAMAREVGSGVIDRYRSMPIARSAVLFGRLSADSLRMLATVLVMTTLGYAVGFRFQTGPGGAVAMIVMATAFGVAMCSVAAYIGIAIRHLETVQSVGLFWLGPLMFVSTAFVPAASMPGWLPYFAANQPASEVIDAMRSLALGGPEAHLAPALAWLVGITALFSYLGVRAYRRLN